MKTSIQTTLLCLAKGFRTFAFGLVSVVLAIFLRDRGFSLPEIGFVLSATLVEDAVLSTLVSYFANRLGHKKILLVSSLLIVLCGLTLALMTGKSIIGLALILGIVSPAGFEGGPFASIEHALMARITEAGRRTEGVHGVASKTIGHHRNDLTRNFSHYNLAGFAGAALGSFVCSQWMEHFPGANESAYAAIFYTYAVCGVVLSVIYGLIDMAPHSAPAAVPEMPIDELKKKDRIISSERNKSTAKIDSQQSLRRRPIWAFAALQGLDALGGGFVVSTLISLWFLQRYNAGPEFVGVIFFWCNILAAISFILAPMLTKRFGLLATMVFTHLPCSLALCALPLCPTAAAAGALLLVRSPFSSIDIPVRQAYTMFIAKKEEQVFASAAVNAIRSAGQAIGPALAGVLSLNIVLGVPFVLAGLCKSVYDVSLFMLLKDNDALDSGAHPEAVKDASDKLDASSDAIAEPAVSDSIYIQTTKELVASQ